MNLLAAAVTGVFVYLAAGFLTGNPSTFTRLRGRRKEDGRAKLWLTQAGVDLTHLQFWAGSAVVGLAAFAAAWALSGAWAVALVPGISTGLLPRAYFSRQRTRRLGEAIEAWPDGLRDLVASISAGRALPGAIAAMAKNGPDPLKRAFERFPTLSQIYGVPAALKLIREEMGDPTSDRVIEVLLMAYERGGPTVTRILTDLSEAVVQDLRTIEEIRTAELEQIINARVVFALPWLVLLLMTIRGDQFRDFYQSALDVVTVAIGAALSLLGIWIVSRLSREPGEPRVLGAGGPVLRGEDL
jgi:tight adherence protein B